MSAPPQNPMQEIATWIDDFMDALGGVEITKEVVDAMAMALAIYQTQHAMAQVEVSMQRVGVDQQQIELEKARIQFELEETMPFKREQLQLQREQMQLEDQFSRDQMAHERELMLERSKQEKLRTEQLGIQEAIAQANLRAARQPGTPFGYSNAGQGPPSLAAFGQFDNRIRGFR